MFSFDLLATGLILAAAVVWVIRRFWRSSRAVVDPTNDGPVCGGSCTGCPMNEAFSADPPPSDKAPDPE